ncbi:50S ribosomal protein L35 [Candidatus Parcubacteria bacterium]|nr:50S ribosomal protein L35 [Candidatus Parcubacteria bacterium]
MKTNKSYKKRLKVTRNGKVVARKAGQSHFNAKQSGVERLDKKSGRDFQMTNRQKRRFLANITK